MNISIILFLGGIVLGCTYGISSEPFMAVYALGLFMVAAAWVIAEAIEKHTAELKKLNQREHHDVSTN